MGDIQVAECYMGFTNPKKRKRAGIGKWKAFDLKASNLINCKECRGKKGRSGTGEETGSGHSPADLAAAGILIESTVTDSRKHGSDGAGGQLACLDVEREKKSR